MGEQEDVVDLAARRRVRDLERENAQLTERVLELEQALRAVGDVVDSAWAQRR